MADSATRDETRLVAELNDLLKLDHDAIGAYTIAIDSLKDESYKESLRLYRGDHERHVRDLTQLIETRGAVPIQMPHLPTGLFKMAMQQAAKLGGDEQVLLAFRTNERQVRDKYRKMANEGGHPADVALVIERNARDEETHYSWVQQVLEERGTSRSRMGQLAGRMEETQARAMSGMEKVERGAIQAGDRVRRAVKNNPVRTAVLAVGASVLAAALARRR